MKHLRKIIVLPVVLLLLICLTASEEKKTDEILEKMISCNFWSYQDTLRTTNFGSLESRHDVEWDYYNWDILNDQEKKLMGISLAPASIPKITPDKIKINQKNQKGSADISFTLLYEIKDNFIYAPKIFKIGYDVYFLLENSIKRKEKKFNGVFRINDQKWYDMVTGTKFQVAVDMGGNRVLAFDHKNPSRLYGFDWNFANDFYVNLPDFRFRQTLHKLNNKRFLFHNARVTANLYAVEIYDISGKRLRECFDYVPYRIKPHKASSFSLYSRTVLTTDRMGHFYIAFQYPQNPYRIWKYDENGKKLKVFGNYFTEPDLYEFPDEWITMDSKDIRYYGLRKLYAVNTILVDAEGRLLVFFSENKIKRKIDFKKSSDIHNQYVDVYSREGDFLGRGEFKYGFPDVVNKDIIYSRSWKEEKRYRDSRWIITATRITIK